MAGNSGVYHTHISSQKKWFELNLKEVWQYRDLISLFVKRSFILQYKQTVLGPTWIFLNPFVTTVIYTIVFGRIAGISTEGVPQLLYYMLSNAVWSFFASCINKTASTFTANAGVFGKVYFPRLTTPISSVLSAAINFGVQLLMFLFFFIYYLVIGQISPNWPALIFLPLILLQLGALGLGCGIIVSSLTTKYRDLAIVVSFGVQLWMYATPVVYPLSMIGQGSRMYIFLLLNPVTSSIEAVRYMFLGQGTVSLAGWAWSIGFTVIVLLFGVMLFNRVEKTFMDTV